MTKLRDVPSDTRIVNGERCIYLTNAPRPSRVIRVDDMDRRKVAVEKGKSPMPSKNRPRVSIV